MGSAGLSIQAVHGKESMYDCQGKCWKEYAGAGQSNPSFLSLSDPGPDPKHEGK